MPTGPLLIMPRGFKKFTARTHNTSKMADYTLHPFLESGDVPAAGLWYAMPGDGDLPCARVGHTFVQWRNCIHLFGGANADGPFADLYSFDLRSFM
jgi:hypothetical protein